ncbi:hypothetical protein EJ06DRAFT_358474 [Trichodelitschia bisporula]|uniref:Uncharacterized protein n=1 Tax=Trichodelitschia bisporula TaxID=703511 RepID=A0A6G1I0B3_9PEZI|nr:hypothetical protein EJ06DRAFT_358474 [Trichodelitschia bisporula]
MTSLPTEPALPPTSTSTHSLAAAATLNAGMQNDARSRRGSERRRSSVRMSLTLNDPTLPSPGELQMSPRQHHRAPSLSEIAQDMEAEQEMHVNRLLSMIRHQQAQIQTLTSQSSAPPSSQYLRHAHPLRIPRPPTLAPHEPQPVVSVESRGVAGATRSVRYGWGGGDEPAGAGRGRVLSGGGGGVAEGESDA